MARKVKESLYNFPNPMDNSCLVGHSTTLKAFTDAWNGRNAHPIHPVWILTGPRGIGKATLAYKIAKIVYGNIGDFFIIDISRNIDEQGKPKPDSKTISVFTIRAMIEKLQMSSMSDDWRVVLIDSLDELHITASNAILKLLEEPPAKTLFLLVAHSLSNVLPTIRSRARVEKMRPLSISELRDLCTKFIPNEPIDIETLRLVNGSFGKITDLKESGGDKIYEELIQLLQNNQTTSSDLMKIATKIAPSPELYTLLSDAVAYFGLADLYPMTTQTIRDISKINLEPGISIFKILTEIKTCL